VSLAGEVAATYVQLRTLEDRKRHVAGDVELQRRSMKVAEDRQASGAVPDLDAVQLLALVRETEAQIPPLDASIRQARNALCLLLGKPPGQLDQRLAAEAPIPSAPPQLALGIPADLLRRRADVRRAERLAAAACERIGMAKSELYPQFSLVGSVGWSSSHSSDLFDDDSERGAYGAGLKWNILLYAFIMDAARLHDAEYQEALYEYQNTVLRAAKEVEDDSVAFVTDHEQLAKLTEALEAQRRAVELSSDMYAKGSVDLSRVLDAGGGWESIDPERIVDDATWKTMDERTDWDWYMPDRPDAPASQGG
jgi:outer membrane protein TolC